MVKLKCLSSRGVSLSLQLYNYSMCIRIAIVCFAFQIPHDLLKQAPKDVDLDATYVELSKRLKKKHMHECGACFGGLSRKLVPSLVNAGKWFCTEA